MENGMTEEEALTALAEARTGKQGWLRIAELLEAVRESDVGGKPGKLSVAFIDEAAKASRYAPAILRRMSAARAFLFGFHHRHPGLGLLNRLDGSTAQFSKVELLARLYKAAPAKAIEVAGAVADGSLRTRDLDELYREVIGLPTLADRDSERDPFSSVPFQTSSEVVRRRFIYAFDQACWDALRNSPSTLSGEGDIRLTTEFTFTYFNPFAIAVGMRDFGIDFIDGIHVAELPAEPSRAEMNHLLKEVAFQAPFFRRFWLLVSPNAPREAICGDLDTLGLGTVGYAELNAGNLVVRRNAAAQRSIEQQARLAEGVLEMGIPARGKAAP
jgi:hypothetical protein